MPNVFRFPQLFKVPLSCDPDKNTEFDLILSVYLNSSKNLFSNFAKRATFGILLSFKLHQNCYFQFKASEI